MSTLLDIIQGIIYVIVSLIIIAVLGVIYLGFVTFVLFQELFKYLKEKLQ
jgi:hypothetical protein